MKIFFDEDEFLSSYVPDRLYDQVTEPANASTSSKDNTEVEHQLDL